MGGWGRDTPWRQGHILAAETASKLDIAHPENDAETVVLVISHDCDLAYHDLGIEPNCEVMVGRSVEKLDGNCSWGKNARKLQLPFTGGSLPLIAEFLATSRQTIPKAFLDGHEPAANVRLTYGELTGLQI